MLKIYRTLTAVLLLLLIRGKSTSAKAPALQYSKATLQLARGMQMATYMDENINPCDDFYSWACGRWPVRHPASVSKRKTSFIGLLEDLYVSKCATALQEPIKSDGVAAADMYLDNLLKTVFHSCCNVTAIATAGYAPIWDALELHGGWPLITDNEWFETEYDWLRSVVLAKRKFNVDVFIGFEVVKDLQHPQINRIQFSSPQLALHADTKRADYRRYIEEKLEQFFPEMSTAWSKQIASQVLEVEEQLLNAVLTASNGEPPLDRYIAELKASYGNYVDLSRYLQLMFERAFNDKVYETPKGYFKNLVNIIRLTPKLALANYTLWKVVDQFDRGGHKDFCVRKLAHFLPNELEYFFKRNYDAPEIFQELQTIFHKVKYMLNDELQTSPRFNWISPHTLKNLREKLISMRVEVAQPQEEAALFHGGIKPADMQSGQYYSNIINLLEWQNEMELLKLHQAAALLNTSHGNPQYAQKLLPAYNPPTNTIQIPVIFLQQRFFWDPAYPVAIEYGTFGFLLAQQIVHGLSEDASDTDEQKEWDVASELAFAKRFSCYAQQSHYAAKELRNRVVTDRERLKKALMDNGGISIAYLLYEKWAHDKHNKELSVLPRLPISHMQQFFLAYAQLFCADDADEVMEYYDLQEALRVNGALANLEGFAKAFQCSDDDKMKLKDKCVLF